MYNSSFTSMSKSSYDVLVKGNYWNFLVLIMYSCMMMKNCLFVSSDRYVIPIKEHSRIVHIIEILIASFPGASC